VARQQTSNFAEKKYTVGLDLGDRWSWYCVLDEHAEVVLEHKVSTTAKALREVFGAMPHSRVALETGMHSPWISRLMKELGHEVIVAQARKVRLIGGAQVSRATASAMGQWRGLRTVAQPASGRVRGSGLVLV
jgi:transposase